MSKEKNSNPCKYNLGDKVIARWVDGKRYPGQIHQVLTFDSYMVLFEDGLQKVVKVNHIEPNLNPVPRSELPFEDPRAQRAIHESDICDLIINCCCGSFEDTGFLIQCDHCLTFQHAVCLDVKTDADLLEAITCSSCLNPKGVRESCRYKFDHSWLKDGTLPNLMQKKDEPLQANKRIASVNYLLEAALKCSELIRGLRAKIPLKKKKIDSCDELKCWSKSWLTTDFENLPTIKSYVTSSAKSITPSKVKGKSKKSRSSKKKISKGGIGPDSIDPFSSVNADDSNISSTSISNHFTINNIGESIEQNERMTYENINQSFRTKDNLSMSSDDLDEICHKNLQEHIENIRNELEIRLEYIESRINELEEWYGPDLDPNDIEANRTEFRIGLKNLHSDLKTFEKIQFMIKRQQSSNSIEESNEIESDSDYDYQPVIKGKKSTIRKKKN